MARSAASCPSWNCLPRPRTPPAALPRIPRRVAVVGTGTMPSKLVKSLQISWFIGLHISQGAPLVNPMDSKLIVRARLHSSIRNSGPVSFAISVDGTTTVRAVKELLLQKAQKAPGAPEWNAPSSPSAFIMRLNDTVPLVNEDVRL